MKRFLFLFLTLTLFCLESYANLIKSSPSGEEIWRFNCGLVNSSTSTGYVDTTNNLWMKDESYTAFYRWGYVNGFEASTSTTVSGAPDGTIYQTHRFGPSNMMYRIDLPNGSYRVTLLFSETFWTQPGQRVFDVAIEGNLVLDNHDILTERAPFEADSHTFSTNVNDQVLDISFPEVSVDNAMISGIEIVPLSITEDAFLDFIQKKMFWYFWFERDPVTSIIRDVGKNWDGTSLDIATLGGIGFGLSAYTIGVERGWISAQEAHDRIMTILNAFKPTGPQPRAENIHGFWYHGIDMTTLQRVGNFELSTVDSGLLIMGAIQAGEYFRQTFPDITSTVDELYRGMEWTWWLNRSTGPPQFPLDPPNEQFVNHAWRPEFSSNDGYEIPGEGGYFVTDWWNRYSETLFVDLLAFGSPDHSISTAAWTNMMRFWESPMGYHMIHVPPLFAHQFHHLYFDFRDKHDGFANYWNNTKDATLYQRDYGRSNPLYFEQDLWGLSNCFGPDFNYRQYGVPPYGFDDGTIAPTAALTSMPFTFQDSYRVARYLFFQYKHHVWGRYGFSDAINLVEDYVAADLVSLENGSIVLAIENYRTGLIRDTFMQNPHMQTALNKIGLLSYTNNPLALASSAQNTPTTEFLPRNVLDINMTTRWSSEFGETAWIALDFGEVQTVSHVIIDWEEAYATQYRVQSSMDFYTWSDIVIVTDGDGGRDELFFPPVNTRYIRILGEQRALPCCGYSIWEMSANNNAPPSDPNATLNLFLSLDP